MLKSGIYDFFKCRGGTNMCFVLGFGRKRPDLKQYRIPGLTYGYMYLMRRKSETFEKFKEFQNEVENQLGKTIKLLRSDRGGEYLSQEFDDHLKSRGIVPQLNPPGTPQRKGVSKRRNRTLLDMV